jgi:RNA polymerase-binding transcription factor DksA
MAANGRKTRAPKDPLEERAQELERIRQFVDRTSFEGDERESVDELSSVDNHPADIADMTFQREMDQTVRRIVEVEEDQLRHAMERRAAGQYGICENCGREIPKERLKARPEATLCIDCQREQEKQR